MKRAPELARLSRDHHQALVVAQALRRGGAGAREAFLSYWSEHGERHFELEERVLLPAYARHADPADPLVVRVLVDHVVIRREAQALAREEVTVERLAALGRLIDDHVRHEERQLFPAIERALASDELAEVAAALEAG